MLTQRQASVRGWLALTVAALAVAACRGRIAGGERTVEIGYAELNHPEVQEAVQLAIEALNARRAQTHIQFRMRTPSDARGDPVRAAAELRAAPAVVGVIGALWSQDMLNSVVEYESLDRSQPPITAIAVIATNADLSGISPWVFRMCATDSQEAFAAARFAIDSLHAKRVAMVYYNEAFGRDWSSAFRTEFERRGGQVLLRRPILDDPRDLALYVEHIEQLHPDLVVLPAVNPSTIRAFSDLLTRFPLLAGDPSEDVQYWDKPLRDVHYAALFSYDSLGKPDVMRFVRALRARRPRERPGEIGALAYDATMAIGNATIIVGPHRDRVRQFLADLGGSRPALRGLTGPIAFDQHHDPVNAAVVIQALRR